jgi:hypothetical protein
LIDSWLEQNLTAPATQRNAATRVHHGRLVEEHGVVVA